MTDLKRILQLAGLKSDNVKSQLNESETECDKTEDGKEILIDDEKGEYYAEYDEDTGDWCVFNTENTKAVGSHSSKEDAEADAKRRNGGVDEASELVKSVRAKKDYDGRPVYNGKYRNSATDSWKTVRNADNKPIAYKTEAAALAAAKTKIEKVDEGFTFTKTMEALMSLDEENVDHSEPANSAKKARTYPYDAFTFKSGGSLKNRYVQANAGDNPLENAPQIDESFDLELKENTYSYGKDDFLDGYIEAMTTLWSEEDFEGKNVQDISDETMADIQRECAQFQQENNDLLDAAYENGYTINQAGIDFYLTRNGHGAGYWDREQLEGGIGDKLSGACEKYGSSDEYVGDDGKIYAM